MDLSQAENQPLERALAVARAGKEVNAEAERVRTRRATLGP